MRIRLLFTTAHLLLLAALLVAQPAGAKPAKKKPASCALHTDCKGQGEYCRAQLCAPLGANESYLVITPESSMLSAYLYIDGIVMGQLPWEGVIAAGVHTIRVEAAGMQPVEFQGTSLPGVVDYVPIRMQPAAVVPPAQLGRSGQPGGAPPPGGSRPGSGERGTPGTLHVALFGGGAYGTASWGSGGWRRPIGTVLGGGAVGLRVATDPVWLDLAFAVTSESSLLVDYTSASGDTADWGDFLKLHFGIQARLLFPVKKNLFYMGAELEPGYALGSRRYAFVNLQLAMSIFVNELFEIRINPIGGEYLQELRMKGWIAGYHATVGLALRFPKKPLF